MCKPETSVLYEDHYAGKCGCDCTENSECNCDCILLARLDNDGNNENPAWSADHSVRRFIRPVLMRDPQVEYEIATKVDSVQAKAQETNYQSQAKATTESTSRNATPDPTKGRTQRKGQPNVNVRR